LARVCTTSCRWPPSVVSTGEGKRAAHHAAAVVEGAPREFAGQLVEAAETAAGLEVKGVAIEQRRADRAEGRRFGFELLRKIEAPALLTAFHVEADEDVAHADHIQTLAVAGRRRADPVAVRLREEGHRHRAFPFAPPKFLARRAIERAHPLALFAHRLGHENPPAGDDRSGVARLELDPPHLLQGVLLQRTRPRFSVEHSVAAGPAPLRPIFRDGTGNGDGNKEGQVTHGSNYAHESAPDDANYRSPSPPVGQSKRDSAPEAQSPEGFTG